jgi:hypothetical protein
LREIHRLYLPIGFANQQLSRRRIKLELAIAQSIARAKALGFGQRLRNIVSLRGDDERHC